MRFFDILLVAQAIVLVRADGEPATVKWTLHKSCYEFSGKPEFDESLAEGVILSAHAVKDWASNGAKKLDASINGKDQITKDAVLHLIGKDGYEDAAKDVRDKFKKLEKLEGPVGKDGAQGKRYDRSQEWRDLEGSDQNYFNFRFVCRPEIVPKVYTDGRKGLFNLIEKVDAEEDDIALQWLAEEKAGKQPDLSLSAYVFHEEVNPPEGSRRNVPQAINFKPGSLKEVADNKFQGWTEQVVDSVAAENALEITAKDGFTPVDFLACTMLETIMFHEMFHLSAFGWMEDDDDSYGWVNNVRNKDHENPDYLALIALVIEFRHNAEVSFEVLESGEVNFLAFS